MYLYANENNRMDVYERIMYWAGRKVPDEKDNFHSFSFGVTP